MFTFHRKTRGEGPTEESFPFPSALGLVAPLGSQHGGHPGIIVRRKTRGEGRKEEGNRPDALGCATHSSPRVVVHAILEGDVPVVVTLFRSEGPRSDDVLDSSVGLRGVLLARLVKNVAIETGPLHADVLAVFDA